MSHQQYSDVVLSLFSGAGGLSQGFCQAGVKPLAGFELNPDACATYSHNLGSPCHQVDLSAVEPAYIHTFIRDKNPFIVIGGPPCQGFSTAGNRLANDPRNRLIFNYLNIVDQVRPRWFLFENVEGVLTSGGGAALIGLVSEFIRIGYSVRIKKVNFAAYGLPQTRKRVVIIGNRMGIDFEFPKETHSFASGKSRKINGKPFAPPLDECLAGLGIPSRLKDELVTYATQFPVNAYDTLMRGEDPTTSTSLHYHTTTEQDQKRFKLLVPGQTMKDLPEEMWHDSFKRRANRRVKDGTPTEKRGGAPSGIKRLHGNLNCLTITGAASREFIHPHSDRTLTLRECARIQSFSDQFEFVGNAASIAQQIGNAVPPLAASVFAHHIMEIDGAFGADSATKLTTLTPRLLGFNLTEATGMSPALEKTYDRLFNFMQLDLEL